MAGQVIVTPQTIFRMSSEGTPSEIRLSSEAWRVLAQVDGARSVEGIARNLNVSPDFVVGTAQELHRLGLLAPENGASAPARATVGSAFFAGIEKELVKVIGPIGPLLIEEEVANLGEARDSFPRDQVAALVERVSAQIADENKRVGFQRIMLEAIQKL